MLIGRNIEIARLAEVIATARDRNGAAVLRIAGPPGVGKSALVDHAVSVANGVEVCRIRCRHSESDLAFGGLSQIVRSDRLCRMPIDQQLVLNAACGEIADRPDRLRVGVALLAYLSALAEERALLVVIDDAHLLDDASSLAFAFACRRLVADGVAVVVAQRPQVTDVWDDLPELELGGLDVCAASELAASLVDPRPADAVLTALHAGTGGLPLAVIDAVHALSAEQLAGSTPLPDPLPVGERISDLYRQRLAALPSACRNALVRLACDDDPAGYNPDHAPALDAGLIVCERDTIRFRHALVRSAIYHSADHPVRVEIHRDLARSATTPERAAHHLLRAGSPPNDAVAEVFSQVACRARARGGLDEASTWSERAATFATSECRAAALRLEAARDAYHAGNMVRAASMLDTVRLDLLEGDAGDEAAQLLASIALFRGDPRALSDLLVARAERSVHTEQHRAANHYLNAAIACIVAGDTATASVIADAAQRLDDRPQPIHELVAGIAATERDEIRQALLHLESAALLLDGADPATDHLPMVFTALALGVHRRLPAAERLIGRVLGAATDRHLIGVLPFALAVSSLVEYWSGRWHRAESHALEAIELSRAIGHGIGPSHTFGLFVLASRGREETFRQSLARGAAETGELGLTPWRRAALGRLELTLERPDEAAIHLEAALNAGPPGFVADWRADLIEAHHRCGQIERECDLLGELEAWGDKHDDPAARAFALHARVRASSGPALDALVAEAQHAQVPDRFWRARLELDIGERLRRDHRLIDARAHLRDALETFNDLDATPWAGRTQRELRACRGVPPPNPQANPLSGLTPQERRVAFAIADGLTNREAAARLVLSAKTIAFHLGKVYRKLGIRSRVELTRIILAAEVDGRE